MRDFGSLYVAKICKDQVSTEGTCGDATNSPKQVMNNQYWMLLQYILSSDARRFYSWNSQPVIIIGNNNSLINRLFLTFPD
jgi:hypothetical protein